MKIISIRLIVLIGAALLLLGGVIAAVAVEATRQELRNWVTPV